jgi:hypothetical protein
MELSEAKPHSGAEYEADLAAMKLKMSAIEHDAMQAIGAALRTPDDQVKYTGYRNQQEIAIGRFQYYQKNIDKLIVLFIKKYPD